MSIPCARLLVVKIMLLGALVGLATLDAICSRKILRLNTDYTDVVTWVKKGRFRMKIAFRTLLEIERAKKHNGIKF